MRVYYTLKTNSNLAICHKLTQLGAVADIEHVIRCLKIFRILAQLYRHRRLRFGLRSHLTAEL